MSHPLCLAFVATIAAGASVRALSLARRSAVPRLTAAAVPLGLLLAAGCMTRLTNDERTKIEFWGTVSAETETAVRELSEEGRGQLLASLPTAEREPTWQGVLDVLDDRPSLEPLADRIRGLVDREIDAGVRVELATPSGNARLRHLILTSIRSGLAR